MYAITVPTVTIVPSDINIFLSFPLEYASISTTVLSVSTSAILSPLFTSSPSLNNHLTIVPSVISAPIEGIVTSVINFSLLENKTYSIKYHNLIL